MDAPSGLTGHPSGPLGPYVEQAAATVGCGRSVALNSRVDGLHGFPHLLGTVLVDGSLAERP
jgi:hypothetical protein